MDSRRIARRVVLSKRHQNTRVQAANSERLATKDMHYQVQLFPCGGGVADGRPV